MVVRILRAVENPIEIENGVRASVAAGIGLSRFPVDGTSSEALISRKFSKGAYSGLTVST